jgi:hypothetical protein
MDVLRTVVTERNLALSAKKDEQMKRILDFVLFECMNSNCEKCLAILGPIDKLFGVGLSLFLP